MQSSDPFEQLRAAVATWAHVPDEAIDAARSVFHNQRFNKNEFLARPGDPARYVYFINRGLVRLYYEGPGGKETNKSFARENMFVSGSLGAGGPGDFGVEALEPTETLAVLLEDLLGLGRQEPGWVQLRNAYIAWLAERKARREKQLLLESAEERYLGFLRDFPDIAERIPQYHVALYLGITDVGLSRIKKRLRETQ